MTAGRPSSTAEVLAEIRTMAAKVGSAGTDTTPRGPGRRSDPDAGLTAEQLRERENQRKRIAGGRGWLAKELTPEQLEAEMERRRARAREKYGTSQDPERGEGGGP